MDKNEVYAYLNEKEIKYEVTEHKAVYTMEELREVELPYPEADAKNVFVRDDKKKNYYLITLKADKRVDLKRFRQEYKTRPLSFVSEKDLRKIIDLIPGAVGPLGVLSDEECRVECFIDEEFVQGGRIGVHPNDNTATVWLKTEDLIKLIEEHGNKVRIVRF